MLEICVKNTFLITQFIAIIIIAIEIVYLSFQKPSKYRNEFTLLLCSTAIMLIGYSIELYATSAEIALVATGVSYIGKPFTTITSFLFIASYCGYNISKKITIPLSIYGAIVPVLVLTNGIGGANDPGHHLYYATVTFIEGNDFSPIAITHGPLYYTYMAFLISIFLADFIMLSLAIFKSKTKERITQLILVFCIIFSALLGYILYLSGITGGYDTTMTGSAIGSFFLTIVFFKYRIFDTLTTAKEHALEHASNGLLVLNDKGKVVYTNKMVDELLKTTFTLEELNNLNEGTFEISKDDHVFEIFCANIFTNESFKGKTIEITDNTVKYNYRIQLEKDVAERTQELKTIQTTIISSFAGLVEKRDNSTGLHIKRMSHYVELIAKSLYENGDYPDIINENYITMIYETSPLHDIGKITIPDSILQKPGRLTDEEFEIIKTHAANGGEIILESLQGVEKPEYVQMAESIAHHHHEKWDGSGYPDHLKGEDIPLAARIVAVADVFDAIRSERCYKPPMDIEEALQVILDGKGKHFDPTVVDAFMRTIDVIKNEK